MIVLHPTAERLLRRLADAGKDGLALDLETVPPGDLASLVLDDFAEVRSGRVYVTGKGAAHVLRVVL